MLDLTEVTFLGSAGLAVLVAAKDDADTATTGCASCPARGSWCGRCRPPGCSGIFDIADGVPQALEAAR